MSLRSLDGHQPSAESLTVRECPVCRKLVNVQATYFTHRDKARRRCPMSGNPAPTRWAATGMRRR